MTMQLSTAAAGFAIALLCVSCSAQHDSRGDDAGACNDARNDIARGDVSPDRAMADLFQPVPLDDPWWPTGSSGDGFYSSEYLSMVIVAEDDSGQQMVLVAGRHSKHQPYFQKQEPWDDVLLVYGGTALTTAGPELPGFEVAFDDAAGWVRVYLDLEMTDSGGAAVPVAADLNLVAMFLPAEFLGLDLGQSGDDALGMTHRPAFLSGDAGSSSVVAVGDQPAVALTSYTGEFEVGSIDYVTDPGMAFKYDYVCLVCPGKGYVYLHFSGHALSPEGPFGEAFEELLSKSMVQEFTVEGGVVTKTRPDGLPEDLFTTAGTVLVSHTEDVGLADMERQIVQIEDADFGPVWGVRELFFAK